MITKYKYGHRIVINFSKNKTYENNLLIIFVPHYNINNIEYIKKFITSYSDTIFIFDNLSDLKNKILYNRYKTTFFLNYDNIIKIFENIELKILLNKYVEKIIYGCGYSFKTISKLSSLYNLPYYIENPKILNNNLILFNNLLNDNATIILNNKDDEYEIISDMCKNNNASLVNASYTFNLTEFLSSEINLKRNELFKKCITEENNLQCLDTNEQKDIDKIKIYIINQESRNDRKRNMENQLKAFNITNYEFFKAYDKNNEDVLRDYDKYKSYSNYKDNMGVIGLIHSTINLFKYINENTDDDYVIILEDDAFLHNNFRNLFMFDFENKEADFVFLGYNMNYGAFSSNFLRKFKKNEPKLIEINHLINKNAKFLGTYAYMCNKKYRNIRIEKGVEWFLNKNYHVDYGYKKLNLELQDKINYYIFGGEYLVVPYMLDTKGLTYNKKTSHNWYASKLVNVNNYYNSINIITSNAEHSNNDEVIKK